MSKLKLNNNVAIALYARFPSEMAYGHHVVEVAKGFTKNNCNVNIYYPKTYNEKTLAETPAEFYGKFENINYIEVSNVDITSFKIYKVLPNLLKKILYSLNTFIWARKLKSNMNESFIWSTNPNILVVAKKYFQISIYEKHGQGKYIQNFSIKKLSKSKNVQMIGVTSFATKELSTYCKNVLYLPNGVDTDQFCKVESSSNERLTIGYIGMLETYGVDKGVLESVQAIDNLQHKYNLNVEIIGGPEYKLQELNRYISTSPNKKLYSVKSLIPHREVPEVLNRFDVGIVPYPDETHMNKYASPMKIFEMASCGIPILASDIKSHIELEKFNLGIVYFKNGNFNDFLLKLENLISNEELRYKLSALSIKNIENFSWKKRMGIILSSARSSTG